VTDGILEGSLPVDEGPEDTASPVPAVGFNTFVLRREGDEDSERDASPTLADSFDEVDEGGSVTVLGVVGSTVASLVCRRARAVGLASATYTQRTMCAHSHIEAWRRRMLL
jgi:hypothetical protein